MTTLHVRTDELEEAVRGFPIVGSIQRRERLPARPADRGGGAARGGRSSSVDGVPVPVAGDGTVLRGLQPPEGLALVRMEKPIADGRVTDPRTLRALLVGGRRSRRHAAADRAPERGPEQGIALELERRARDHLRRRRLRGREVDRGRRASSPTRTPPGPPTSTCACRSGRWRAACPSRRSSPLRPRARSSRRPSPRFRPRRPCHPPTRRRSPPETPVDPTRRTGPGARDGAAGHDGARDDSADQPSTMSSRVGLLSTSGREFVNARDHAAR